MNQQLIDIVTKDHGLHGVTHTVLGGVDITIENCPDCKTTLDSLNKYISENYISKDGLAHVIGSNELESLSGIPSLYHPRNICRNELRAEQRRRAGITVDGEKE